MGRTFLTVSIVLSPRKRFMGKWRFKNAIFRIRRKNSLRRSYQSSENGKTTVYGYCQTPDFGGLGISFKLLQESLKPGTDPLSPDNPIVVGQGPLGGTLIPGPGRCSVTMKYPIRAGKSEEKHYISHSTSGSRRFGVMLKNTGYDHRSFGKAMLSEDH